MNHNRIAWKCRRGMLELDLIFNKFLEEKYPHLSVHEQKVFEELLDEQDPVLASWLFGSESPNPSFTQIISQIKSR